jgi:CIC family chloride channel protein
VGFAAVVIKNSVHFIQVFLKSDTFASYNHYSYIFLPIIGISLAVFFIRFIIRKPVGHGIPSVLYSIAETRGFIKKHNMFSSIVTSALTVGFGGSVGLEGPTVATGAAYGSTISHALKIPYKQVILLLGAACASAMSAIFKAPLTGVVFAMEVIMIDLTVASVIPLIIASVTAILTSYFFMGTEVLYHFELKEMYRIIDLPYFALLGIFTGLVSVYFTKVYIYTHKFFERYKSIYSRLLIGGGLLGALIYLFPALFGEGYEVINETLQGNADGVYKSSILNFLGDNTYVVLGIMLAVVLFKAFATSLTFTAGGVGGIFAPTLFNGSIVGLLFAKVLNLFGVNLPDSNFALAGMAGAIAGVLQAPLTAIFLIAEISGGYQLLIPLMIVSLVSYLTSRVFINNSVYTYQLAERGHLLTHHADNNILKMMSIKSLLETDFKIVHPGQKLRHLVDVIQDSNRNMFPVVELDGTFRGMIMMEDIRKIIFKPQLYDSIEVDTLMIQPQVTVLPTETMSKIASKLHKTSLYNIPVLDEDGKYLGFVSRANVFSEYRKLLKDFSSD